MKTYLFRFLTNYEEAGIIITTNKGLDYAKEKALYLGAWDVNDITEINTEEEGVYNSVNFNLCGKLNDIGVVIKDTDKNYN